MTSEPQISSVCKARNKSQKQAHQCTYTGAGFNRFGSDKNDARLHRIPFLIYTGLAKGQGKPPHSLKSAEVNCEHTPFPTASHRKTQTDMRMFTHAHMCVYTHEDMSAHLSMTLVIAFCNMCIIAGSGLMRFVMHLGCGLKHSCEKIRIRFW